MSWSSNSSGNHFGAGVPILAKDVMGLNKGGKDGTASHAGLRGQDALATAGGTPALLVLTALLKRKLTISDIWSTAE